MADHGPWECVKSQQTKKPLILRACTPLELRFSSSWVLHKWAGGAGCQALFGDQTSNLPPIGRNQAASGGTERGSCLWPPPLGGAGLFESYNWRWEDSMEEEAAFINYFLGSSLPGSLSPSLVGSRLEGWGVPGPCFGGGCRGGCRQPPHPCPVLSLPGPALGLSHLLRKVNI